MNFIEWLHSYGNWTHKGRAVTNGSGLLFLLGLSTILGMLVYPWYAKAKRIKKIKAILGELEKQDKAWNKEVLIDLAYRDYFTFIQRWCDQDLENIKSMSDSVFYVQCESKINKLKHNGYKEEIKHITIKEKEVMDVYSEEGEEEFTVLFVGIAQSKTLDAHGNVIGRKPNNFKHFLTYRKSNNHWKLADFNKNYKMKKYKSIALKP